MASNTHLRRLGLAGTAAIVTALLTGGCASQNSPACDSLAAQTSRSGWAVGDSIGVSIANKREATAMAMASRKAAEKQAVASESKNSDQ